MSHHMVKCERCKTIISQCRCMSQDKEVKWDICKECFTKNSDKERISELEKTLAIRNSEHIAIILKYESALREIHGYHKFMEDNYPIECTSIAFKRIKQKCESVIPELRE